MNFLSNVGNSIMSVPGTVANAVLSVPGAVVNAGANLAIGVATSARDMTINSVVTTAKYVSGYSNLENAGRILTRVEDRKIVLAKTNLKDENGVTLRNIKEYKIKKYRPSTWQNIKEAVNTEALPLAIKGAYMHGAASTIGASYGLVEAGGVTSTLFNASAYVATPFANYVASKIVNNVITSAAAVTTIAVFYSAKKDIDALSKDTFGVNNTSAPGYIDTAKQVSSAFAKAAIGAAIITGTIVYNR